MDVNDSDLSCSRSQGLKHHLLRVGFSRASAQAIVFISLPLLSRLYKPGDFGVWALIQSTALLVSSVATLRFELAVVLPQDHDEALALLGMGLSTAILVSIICTAVMPWALPLVLGAQKIADMRLAGWAIPALVFFTAANQLGLAWCTRTMAFGLYGGSQLLLAIASALIPAWLAIHPLGANGLVLGTIMSLFLVQVALWAYTIMDIRRRNLYVDFCKRNMIELLFKYRSYPLYMTPYTMIGAIRDRIIYFFIGNYGSAGEVGLYSMAQRLTNAPNTLVSSTIRPVLFQFAVNQKKETVHRLVYTIMMKLVMMTVPLIIFYLFYAERLLSLFLGNGWAKAAPYSIILIMPMFPLLLSNWMDRYLDVLGHQRLAFIMETIFSGAAVAAITTAFYMGASVRVAVFIQACIMATYYTAWIAVVFRTAGMPLLKLMNVLTVAVCVSVVSTVIVYLGDAIGSMPIAAIFLFIAWSGCVGTVVKKK